MGIRVLFKRSQSKAARLDPEEEESPSKSAGEEMYKTRDRALRPRASTGFSWANFCGLFRTSRDLKPSIQASSGSSSMCSNLGYITVPPVNLGYITVPPVKSICDVPCLFTQQATLIERHEFFCSLEDVFNQPHDMCDWVTEEMAWMSSSNNGKENTLFTVRDGNEIFSKPNRPVLIAVSTTWTTEENFDILLEAAVIYDSIAATALTGDNNIEEEMLYVDISNRKQYLYPRLLFIIIGSGPESETYKEQIKTLHLKRVGFRTLVPSAANCPILLASSDLGISLHHSALLSIKAMDVMDKCGLPGFTVASPRTFSREDEKFGVPFLSADKLADHLQTLVEGFPDECNLSKLLKVDSLDM